jgi:hypothetical protein
MQGGNRKNVTSGDLKDTKELTSQRDENRSSSRNTPVKFAAKVRPASNGRKRCQVSKQMLPPFDPFRDSPSSP